MTGKPPSPHAAHRPARFTKYSAPDRWEWERYTARLVWLYGPERAERIITRRDPATEVDILAWNTLGQVSA